MPLIEIEDDHKVSQVGDIVPAEMDDEDLRECMAMLCVEGADIREQLADPTRIDEGWRIRAQDALRHRVREFEACRVEAIRRGLRNLPDIDPMREAARAKRVLRWQNAQASIRCAELARERQADRRIMYEAQLALVRDREAHRDERRRAFMTAAYEILSHEDIQRVWAHVCVTNPDAVRQETRPT